MCDMRGDIDHNVTCMETLTAMYGDVYHHVICVETFTPV